jgi:hypothetical protein
MSAEPNRILIGNDDEGARYVKSRLLQPSVTLSSKLVSGETRSRLPKRSNLI